MYRTLRGKGGKVLLTYDENGTEKARELNGYHLFVYNRTADFDRQRIGIRYNESWRRLPPEALQGKEDRAIFGGVSQATHYQPLLRDYEAVVHDWQWGEEVDALKVSVPDGIAWGALHRRITEPVRGRAEDFQFIVLPDDIPLDGSFRDLRPYMREKHGAWFLSVTSSGVQKHRWSKGRLITEDWEELSSQKAAAARPAGDTGIPGR